MNSLRLRAMCIAWAAWLMACAGGAANSTVTPEYERTGFETEAGGLTSGFDISVSRAREDIKNRYEAVVQVRSERGACSGVFVTPEVVLTAAHCLCAPADPKSQAQVIDGSDCVTSATVMRGLHGSEEAPARGSPGDKGRVRVHPSFRAEMAGGKLKSNLADLAVVQLGRPVEGIKIDFQFPAQEVSIDEELTVVGFGETRHRGKDEGTRRVGHNAVTDIVLSSGGTGSFLFRAPGAHTHAGDSGGPCFRESPAGRWLVGFNSGHANSGTVSWFTSTFHFRAWLAEQLRKRDTD
ncbi:MAG TPA: trypsin-like serine protease [Hyalangium sp.]|nr:trypsin-like serine protease [Hyalangium sp.]